jgi:peptidoglycan/LPS O-acetylase OafA/YrhL
MNYRREVDGLRAVAVIPVILFHAGFKSFGGGFVGVDIFFVISGYLITSLILAELETGKFSIVTFYERRARRILPALFLVMAACVPLAWLWLLPGDMKEFSHSLAAVSVFASNILFWRESGYFDTAAEFKPLLHTWSLAVEEQFYVLFPLSLVIAWRLGRGWIIPLFALATVMSLAIAQWGALNEPAAAFFLLPTRSWELAMGALAAVYLAKRQCAGSSRVVGEVAPWIGLAMIALSIFSFDETIPFPGVYALLPTVGTVLVILFAWPGTSICTLLSSRLFVGIGLVSYSAYLWHQPLFAFARHRSSDNASPLLLLSLSVGAIALAYLSWRFVEQPFRKKGVISRKKVFSFAVVGSLAFIAFGAAGHLSNGFLLRFDASDQYLAAISKPESGKYVEHRFARLKERSFDISDKRLKVLVIGDSFGQDLVNAVYESDLIKYVQISAHQIPVGCGNLYLKIDFTDRIAASELRRCRQIGWYADASLRKLIKQADSVWLVSAWRPWQAELLRQSVENIENDFGKDVLVFGRKNFGQINVRQLLSVPAAQRLDVANPLDPQHLQTNRLMISSLDPRQFVNVSKIFCGDSDSCRIFDRNGRLYSYDGNHLTEDGARFFGARLMQEPDILSLIDRVHARERAETAR